MMLRRHALLGALLIVMACGAGPMAPSPTRGIVVYRDKDFRGGSFNVQVDYRDLGRQAAYVTGKWCPFGNEGDTDLEDCISSIQVLDGWRAVVYEHGHFLGASLEVTSSIADLQRVPGPCKGTFNDCISSIQIRPHR